MFDLSHFLGWFSLLFLVSAIPVAIMVVFEKRSPYKTIAWILALILLPVLGVLFYLIFGQEYRKRKMFSVRGLKGLKELRRISAQQLRDINQKPPIGDAQAHDNIIRLLLKNSNALLTSGNQLEILKDGQQTFEAIFEAIEKAQHHIHLEYYILANDSIGKKLFDLLRKKRAEGVEVRIIVDDVGSWSLKSKFYNQLREQEIEIFPFMEVRFPRLTSRVNYRNHRKIIVIDGKTGFVGGLNITDRYLNGSNKLGPWRDTHLKITGDAATSLQIIFLADWYFVSGTNLGGQTYLPKFSEADGTPVQIVAGGPDYDWEGIAQGFFAAIANARKRVYIATPYLIPPPALLLALKTAALSHVDVRIIIPEKSDSIISKWGSFSYVEELLEAGVKVYFYTAGFTHSKYMLIDDTFSTIGTTNFDFRSFETNFDANAFIYSKDFNAKLEALFKEDQHNSRHIKLSPWRKRGWSLKLRESLAHIFSPMM